MWDPTRNKNTGWLQWKTSNKTRVPFSEFHVRTQRAGNGREAGRHLLQRFRQSYLRASTAMNLCILSFPFHSLEKAFQNKFHLGLITDTINYCLLRKHWPAHSQAFHLRSQEWSPYFEKKIIIFCDYEKLISKQFLVVVWFYMLINSRAEQLS
jgi:hypothetical protein